MEYILHYKTEWLRIYVQFVAMYSQSQCEKQSRNMEVNQKQQILRLPQKNVRVKQLCTVLIVVVSRTKTIFVNHFIA